MRLRNLHVRLSLLGALLLAPASSAQLLTIELSGTVTHSLGYGWPCVEPGETDFALRALVDSHTPDLDEAPNLGRFVADGEPNELTLEVGPYLFVTRRFEIHVADDRDDFFTDLFSVSASELVTAVGSCSSGEAPVVHGLDVSFSDPIVGSVLESDGLLDAVDRLPQFPFVLLDAWSNEYDGFLRREGIRFVQSAPEASGSASGLLVFLIIAALRKGLERRPSNKRLHLTANGFCSLWHRGRRPRE